MKLPYYIRAFGANIAAFNSLDDARDYALSASIKYQNGWIEVLETGTDFPYFTFSAGNYVERESVAPYRVVRKIAA